MTKTYPCCQHCRDFGRRVGLFGPVDDDHENHTAKCYTGGCSGGAVAGREHLSCPCGRGDEHLCQAHE